MFTQSIASTTFSFLSPSYLNVNPLSSPMVHENFSSVLICILTLVYPFFHGWLFTGAYADANKNDSQPRCPCATEDPPQGITFTTRSTSSLHRLLSSAPFFITSFLIITISSLWIQIKVYYHSNLPTSFTHNASSHRSFLNSKANTELLKTHNKLKMQN